eukprot:2387627-Amphidinium_carterae.1
MRGGMSGERSATKRVAECLQVGFLVKDRGVLGPGPEDQKEMKILNRTLRWCEEPQRIEYEADCRHPPLLWEQLRLERTSRALGTPGTKVAIDEETESPIDDERAT